MGIVRTTVGIAGTCYAANAALGVSVAMGMVNTSGARWVHHGLFIATASTTGLALALGAAQRDPSALALGVATLPLALLQRRGSRPLPRHARTAALAAPCYVAAVLLTRR